ncbi:PAS domain S-box protein [Actinoplanes sp. NPDC026670]|uniref:PAS domain S-box protein n=1 Tax=Actinoplanes sp. NPDC026670 TaxID=3154700 RepID=UPI00340CCC86
MNTIALASGPRLDPSSPVLDQITTLATRLTGGRAALAILESGVAIAGGLDGLDPAPEPGLCCRQVIEAGTPHVRTDTWLGVPLCAPDGRPVGALLVLDDRPHDWTGADVEVLEGLAVVAAGEIAARAAATEAARCAEQLRRILDSTLDAFVAAGPDGEVTTWNRSAERMFGWNELDALGRPIDELIIAPDHRDRFRGWLDEVTRDADDGGQRAEFRAVHRGGRQFPIEMSSTVMGAFIRDITARQHSERMRRLEYAVAGALAAAQNVEQATDTVLAAVGEGLRWPYTEYWHLDTRKAKRLVRLAAWSRDVAMTEPMRAVREVTRGSGVVGHVWETAAACWSTDLSASDGPRAVAAKSAGLQSVVAVPVRNGVDVVGVLAVYDRRRAESDPEVLAALDTVAAHIGQYVHRRRALDLELELARAQRGFDRIVANLSDFLWTVRIAPDGTVRMVYASPDNTGIFGGPAPAGGDLGMAMAEMMHPDDRAAFLAFRHTLTTGQTAETVCRLIGGDGVTRWVWTRGQPRRENGVLFVDGVCSDVTERHRDNARLRQQAELLDLAPTAVIVRDLDGRITYWNRGAATVYGWRPDAVVGCNLHRLLDTRFPEPREQAEESLAGTGRWHGELDHLRSDGTRIVVLSHQSVQYDDAGDPLAILEFNVDVTARKQAERRLADSEERLRTQFSLATVGQATIRLDGRFQHVNPALADILGRQVGDLEQRTLDDITHPDDRAGNHRAAAMLFTENVPSGRHLRLLHADGQVVDAEVGMSLVRDSDGQPASFIAVVQDVTARLAAERERDAAAALLGVRNDELQDTNGRLAEANALKLDLMGMLSHEIGTPLNTIGGYADMLLADTGQLVPAHRKALEVIARSTRRLNLLRAEILTMCTIDAGQLHAEPEPVEVAAALHEVVAGLGLHAEVTCPPDLAVLVHPGHLQQIITNFCTNADKYAGGVTAITVQPAGVNALISVHDSGPGIPEPLRPYLFDRFTRATGADMTIQGTGLGLYIVRGLAEANDGTVGHTPGHPNGSIFTLTLPVDTGPVPSQPG